MKIGDKRVLHNEAFPQNMREGDSPDRFVLVEVIESQPVPAMWGKETYEGYRALGEDGRYYLLNWDRFPDDSMTPGWMWQREILNFSSLSESEKNKLFKQNDVMWYDVAQGMGFIPFFPSWLEKYKQIVHYCPTHQKLSYISDGGCFYCKHCPKGGLPPKDHAWKGWK